MAGLGAGGGATAFTLASVQGLSGKLSLIEPDEVNAPNLNRYIYADSNDAITMAPKVSVIETLFPKSVEVVPFLIPFEEAVSKVPSGDFRYTYSAVDSREARRNIQYETPKILWDAGSTEQGDFYIWRHVLGKTDCMWCKLPPGDRDPEALKAEQLEELLGLSKDVWLRKLRKNEVFRQEEIDNFNLDEAHNHTEFAIPQHGQRYSDWEAEQCGKLPFLRIDDEVPIPFSPVMAGVLIAGEIIKEHYFPEAVLDSYYWNTLTGQFMKHNTAFRRNPRAGCSFCQNAIFREQYARRWV